MNRSKLKVQKVVGILTDPHPEFVSLVNFPANQTPFTAVKFDRMAQEEGEDAEALAQRAASAVVSIQSVTFSKKQFKSVEAVSAYMDENGYVNYAVEDRGEFYFVPGENSEDETEGTGSIEVAKGVTMTVARHRSVRRSAAVTPPNAGQPPVDPGTTASAVQPAAKDAGQTRSHKSLYSVSYFAGVLMDAGYILSDLKWEGEYDGDESESEVVSKFKTWLSDGAKLFETLAADEVAKLVEWTSKAKTAREAELSTKATTVDPKTTPVAAPATAPTPVKPAATSTVEGAPEATPPAADEPNKPQATDGATPPASGDTSKPDGEPPVGTDTGSTDGKGEGSGEAGAPEGTEATPEAGATEASKGAPVPGIDANALAESIGKTVAAAIAPLTETVTKLSETVAKNDKRVTDMEARRQVRRSGDHEDAGTGAPAPGPQDLEKAKREEAYSRRLGRDTLGF